jgi:NAD(P)-dependent dehydrogenase (short-subunit alcohol dehydrogenase family)
MVVTGGSSGLGKAIVEQALDKGFFVVNIAKDQYTGHNQGFVSNLPIDLAAPEAQEQLRNGLEQTFSNGKECHALINCAGVNHIEWLEDLETEDWERVVNVNARAIWWTTQALLPALSRRHQDGSAGTICNVVSNASHMPMTASLPYNASKGAAHIMTLQMARELTPRHGITVFGVSPGKMANTGMSAYIDERVPVVRGWSREQAEQYQQAGLLTGEIDPRVLAEFLLWLLSFKYRHQHLSGCILPYGATK